MSRRVSRFFDIFGGQYVTLYTKIITEQTSVSEEHSSSLSAPMGVSGYLLDHDSEHYYLGDTPDEVNFFVKKEDTSWGGVSEPKTEHDKLLDVAAPSNKEELN